MIRHRSSQSPIIRPGFSRERASAAASEAEFSSPLDYNPFAWYDAADCLAVYGGDATLDEIDGWPSHLVGGNPCMVEIAGTEPVFQNTGGINAGPAIVFDGIDDYLLFGELAASGPKTFFFVIDPDDVTATRTLFYSTTGLLVFGHEGGTGNTFYNYGAGGKVCGSKSDVAQILVFSMSSTTQIARRNGVDLTITSPGWSDVAVGGDTFLGAGILGATAWFGGKIAEIIAYNAALSLEQVQQVEAWLDNKYGLL